MENLFWWQYALIGAIFIWSGFVRSGLGFGGGSPCVTFSIISKKRSAVIFADYFHSPFGIFQLDCMARGENHQATSSTRRRARRSTARSPGQHRVGLFKESAWHHDSAEIDRRIWFINLTGQHSHWGDFRHRRGICRVLYSQ